ncbi:DUF4468 domain-containing protein [Rheinheimera gaetbuli]
MKVNSIFCAALLFTLMGCGVSTVRYVPVEVAQVINVPGKNQQEIYDKARQWFSHYFVSGKSVIDYEDVNTGVIIGNGKADIGSDFMGVIAYGIDYTIRVETKDGRFRVLTNIIKHTNSDSTYGTYDVATPSGDRKNKAKEHVDKIAANIEAYVNSNAHGASSDW